MVVGKYTHRVILRSLLPIIHYYQKQKQRQTKLKINKNILNKSMHKTRLTQNKKTKHTRNAKPKTRRGEREKVIESLVAFFLPHLGRTFPLSEPLNWR